LFASYAATSPDVNSLNVDNRLTILGLGKTLAGNEVLKNINLTVRSGEVHALVGQNGAGKSTLTKCLSGYWKPDAGSMLLADGRPLDPSRHDIAFVQQDLGLIPSLTVLECACLGRGFATGFAGRIKWKAEAARVAALLDDLGHGDIDPLAEVRTLDAVERTVVAIARATQELREGAQILVLDEPTASLPGPEVAKLFAVIRRLRSEGAGIVYVSHHLSEVLAIADRVSVLRDGEVVATELASELDESALVELMLRRKVDSVVRKRHTDHAPTTPVLLTATGLTGDRINNVTFRVYAGEIVGIAGLQGSGCTELAELLFGVRKPTHGVISVKGKDVNLGHPSDAIKAGLALVTEDRHVDGSFLELTLGANIVVSDVGRFFKRGVLSGRDECLDTKDWIDRLKIRPADRNRVFGTLSGGNQQKAIMAKWLRLSPSILICDQPDVGVDVGAKASIYALLEELAGSGGAVVLISNQYADLAALCDRVLVLHDGRLIAELANDGVDEHRISAAVAGNTATAGAQ
jgi:ribose transport system ATP-binding protein